MNDPVVATHALTKRFGRVTAVDGVDLAVPAGSRFGLLGPNGSGKTTLVRMLLGLVHATSGSIEVLGSPMPRAAATVLPRVGALVESPAAWPGLSGRANLTLLDAAGSVGGPLHRPADRRRRVQDALDQVGLGGVDRRPVRAYSLGMRQRLGIASALLRTPELLLLDEPTNGLDPRGIGEMRALLTALNDRGTTVVLSSHLLAEVETLCTRVRGDGRRAPGARPGSRRAARTHRPGHGPHPGPGGRGAGARPGAGVRRRRPARGAGRRPRRPQRAPGAGRGAGGVAGTRATHSGTGGPGTHR
ncbi:ABC transporter ATP-binding protein [Pseudonocardia sp. ICBG1142]|uniref:ABC transporter ATP-binding protein n=1 Tax=Pseudonocardia sp. ICBG1142 TaxID=2846760 RepID=UPI001CF6BDF8|nr:ATP-binding cassette domain-containing protein [Pseudonocardia sp. ICBG1142]